MQGDNAKTPEHRAKLSKAQEEKWKDPEYRKKMVEKQIQAGIRLPYTTDFKHKEI